MGLLKTLLKMLITFRIPGRRSSGSGLSRAVRARKKAPVKRDFVENSPPIFVKNCGLTPRFSGGQPQEKERQISNSYNYYKMLSAASGKYFSTKSTRGTRNSLPRR